MYNAAGSADIKGTVRTASDSELGDEAETYGNDTMAMEIVEESVEALKEYAGVRIAFLVEARLRVVPLQGGMGGLALIQEPIAPYL
jgi:hypothetical protein